MELPKPSSHPAELWQKDAGKMRLEPQIRLRLAALAGHMQVDRLASRRAALIDLLADGRPHPREEIWQTIETQLGEACWGKHPQEALLRDLKVLRNGRLRIAYSRRPNATGYYLQYPPHEEDKKPAFDSTNWTYIKHLRKLSTSEKNHLAFGMADFALRQKRLLLQEEYPEWTVREIDTRARELVYGKHNG